MPVRRPHDQASLPGLKASSAGEGDFRLLIGHVKSGVPEDPLDDPDETIVLLVGSRWAGVSHEDERWRPFHSPREIGSEAARWEPFRAESWLTSLMSRVWPRFRGAEVFDVERLPAAEHTLHLATDLWTSVTDSLEETPGSAIVHVEPASPVDERLDALLTSLTPRLREALGQVESESQLQELIERIASVLPQEHPAAKAIGPVYDTADLVSWLGVSRQALQKRVQRGDMLAIKTSDGHRVYPAWQFASDGSVRPGVAEAVKALAPVMDPWTRAIWFAGKSPALEGKSAAEWLSSGGDPESVVTSARRRAHRMAQ